MDALPLRVHPDVYRALSNLVAINQTFSSYRAQLVELLDFYS